MLSNYHRRCATILYKSLSFNVTLNLSVVPLVNVCIYKLVSSLPIKFVSGVHVLNPIQWCDSCAARRTECKYHNYELQRNSERGGMHCWFCLFLTGGKLSYPSVIHYPPDSSDSWFCPLLGWNPETLGKGVSHFCPCFWASFHLRPCVQNFGQP